MPTPNPVIIYGLSESQTISFPHFEIASGAHAGCNTVTQSFTALSIGTVTWNAASDNQISLPSLTSADVNSYSLTYEAHINLASGETSDVVTRTLEFEIIQCLFEVDHLQAAFNADPLFLIIQ